MLPEEQFIGITHFIAWLYGASQILNFYKLRFGGKSISSIFPTLFAHFVVSVSHFGNSHTISNVFITIIFVRVICDQ